MWMQMQIHEKSNCCQLRWRYTLEWIEYFLYWISNDKYEEEKNLRSFKPPNNFPSFVTRVERALSTMTCMEKWRCWENAYAKLRWAPLDSASMRDGQQSADPPHSLGVLRAQRPTHQAIYFTVFFSIRERQLWQFFFLYRIPWSIFIRAYDSM